VEMLEWQVLAAFSVEAFFSSENSRGEWTARHARIRLPLETDPQSEFESAGSP
jgi:hypothetical protein